MPDSIPKKKNPETDKELERHDVTCSYCAGTGDHPSGNKDRYGDPLRCTRCDGSGESYEWRPKKNN